MTAKTQTEDVRTQPYAVRRRRPDGLSEDEALLWAAENGQEEVVESLLDYGADLAARSTMNRTVLHKAAIRGNVRIMRMLLEKGANVTAEDSKGKDATPFRRQTSQHSSRRAVVGSWTRHWSIERRPLSLSGNERGSVKGK
jgi:ankyrin repeat protein